MWRGGGGGGGCDGVGRTLRRFFLLRSSCKPKSATAEGVFFSSVSLIRSFSLSLSLFFLFFFWAPLVLVSNERPFDSPSCADFSNSRWSKNFFKNNNNNRAHCSLLCWVAHASRQRIAGADRLSRNGARLRAQTATAIWRKNSVAGVHVLHAELLFARRIEHVRLAPSGATVRFTEHTSVRVVTATMKNKMLLIDSNATC